MKKIIDGNTAASLAAYKLNELAIIYPITPSSPMAENIDTLAVSGEKNIFGHKVKTVELQSEGGASGSLHGSVMAGELTTTFTCSQGLLLMIPNMHKIAGELLPTVFHVSARSVASHALSIFGDHSDIYSCRNTGFAFLASSNPQECYDMAVASHIASLKSSIPFLHFFDGFRTSHEINEVEIIDDTELKSIYPYSALEKFRARSLSNINPIQRGTAQNPDIFFQNREAGNSLYNELPTILQETFLEIQNLTGRSYAPYEYIGSPKAKYVIVSMCSSCDTIESTINALNDKGIGLLKVRMYRPFSAKLFTQALPKSVKKIVVLDKTKEAGSVGEPLYLDVVSSLNEENRKIEVIGGRYGLGGKDFSPAMVKAVFDNLKAKKPKNHFTVGIVDDITNTSLKPTYFNLETNSTDCLFYGLGSDGTVSANKNTIKIIGENTSIHAQGYFVYDSKKSGSITCSHLRFSENTIKAPYLINSANFIAIHNFSFVEKFDILEGFKNGGTVLLCANSVDEELLITFLPNRFKRELASKNACLYVIDAFEIARRNNLRGKINTIMQTAFFKLTNIMPFDLAVEKIKEATKKTYKNKGEDVVKNNIKAIEETANAIVEIEVNSSWKYLQDTENQKSDNKYFEEYIKPIMLQKGNSLPVSKMSIDGSQETNTSKLEKRTIAEYLPRWIKEKCMQCNQCSFVCPHAAIRPKTVKKALLKKAPKTFETITLKTVGSLKPDAKLEYKIQVYPQDCTGCGNCAKACPFSAIEMVKTGEILNSEKANLAFMETLPQEENIFNKYTLKGSQFEKPYFEFSGACSGCGETPYIKLLTQLYGNQITIANATGCSSIYGGSSPTCPYSKDELGMGPSWANSLFEDNAEFGYGMKLAFDKKRENLKIFIQENLKQFKPKKVKDLCALWLENSENFNKCLEIEKELENIINKTEKLDTHLSYIKNNLDVLLPKTVWIIGGDGWAYDIGYGGLDHVLASGENIKVLVLDTEVYSNTGGQSSKATPLGAIAKFAAKGKQVNKKSLSLLALTYQNIYVAQIAMGADKNQAIKAFKEAQEYNGPALIIAYSPCINHGIMQDSIIQAKQAVDSGYWHLFRYNPNAENNKLSLDSKEPKLDYKTHLLSEKRFSNLSSLGEKEAENLYNKAKEQSDKMFNLLKSLSEKNK